MKNERKNGKRRKKRRSSVVQLVLTRALSGSLALAGLVGCDEGGSGSGGQPPEPDDPVGVCVDERDSVVESLRCQSSGTWASTQPTTPVRSGGVYPLYHWVYMPGGHAYPVGYRMNGGSTTPPARFTPNNVAVAGASSTPVAAGSSATSSAGKSGSTSRGGFGSSASGHGSSATS